MLDYVAAQDTDGNLVLLWQGYSDEGVDVFYAAYDDTYDVFSLVEQLTHDKPLEKFMAPVFASTGELLMAYGKDELVTTSVQVSPTLVIDNVTTFGQSDLYVLRHTFGPDLTVTAQDIAVSPANPVLGSTATISVTVRNVGDRAVANPKVAIYQGDPASGGVLIGTTTANLTLTGGMSTTVTVDWTVPLAGGPFTLYAVVDPDEAVVEWDETNNEAYTFAALPDLVVADAWADYGAGQGITLTAVISNTGVVDVSNISVAFRLHDPMTGTIVAQTTLANLAVGEERLVQAVWDATSAATGRDKVYAVVDPSNNIVELDEENNIEWAGVGILPDLATSWQGLEVTPAGTGLSITVPVLNLGMRDATNISVGIYDREPVSGTIPLASQNIGIIAAHSSEMVTFTLENGLPGFYVGVNINREVEEQDFGNNILLVGESWQRVYLPFVVENR